MTDKKAAIILAAGKGKRMKSDLPKVLHRINGKPLIRILMETMKTVSFDRMVIVVGFKGEMVIDELKDFGIDFVWQKNQLGTGHAVLMCREHFRDFDGTILVAAGDVPFLSVASILNLFDIHRKNNASATCLSAEFDNPSGYGRIIRKNDSDILLDVIEENDASAEIKRIKEINSGTFCFDSRDLFEALARLDNNNAQQEYYLTDTINILQKAGKKCAVTKVSNILEVAGINSIEQLKSLERAINKKFL
jgi:UDP-N-acetylglucosamine diphosphorylase/glucosamine-1-phosphate N-acetyltransferase